MIIKPKAIRPTLDERCVCSSEGKKLSGRIVKEAIRERKSVEDVECRWGKAMISDKHVLGR